MPVKALVLVICAAFLHASWNLVAKKSNGNSTFAFGSALAAVILWAPVAAYISISNKPLSAQNWSQYQWAVVAVSSIIHSAYYVILLKGYSLAPLSVVYPIARGSGPLLSSMIAIFVFKEQITLVSGSGIALIVSGIILISWRDSNRDLTDPTFLRGVQWGLFTGVFISLYTITDAYGVKTLGMDPILFDFWGNVVRAFILFCFIIKKTSKIYFYIKSRLAGVIYIGIVSPLAYVMVLWAVQIAPVSHIAPARELSLMFGAFLGGKILKEGHIARRFFAAALIAGGIVLLTL